MRKLICNLFMALDGVVEAPDQWSLSYWNDQIQTVVMDGMAAADALLLGRVTYEGFAEAWTGRTNEDDEGADFMNNVPKHVASRTLSSVEWNNSGLLQGDVAQAVTALKNEDGADIATSGSGTLVRSLLQHELVDELRLLVYPVIVGRGRRLCEGDGDALSLRLTHSETFDNGVQYLVYTTRGT